MNPSTGSSLLIQPTDATKTLSGRRRGAHPPIEPYTSAPAATHRRPSAALRPHRRQTVTIRVMQSMCIGGRGLSKKDAISSPTVHREFAQLYLTQPAHTCRLYRRLSKLNGVPTCFSQSLYTTLYSCGFQRWRLEWRRLDVGYMAARWRPRQHIVRYITGP